MPIIISLLRGINVGGNKKIKMADLSDLYASLGFEDTKTLLQSGNAVFKTSMNDMATIKQKIEQGIQDKFGFDVQVILRTPDELRAVIANQPFTAEQISDPAKVAFLFLDAIPNEDAFQDLCESNPGNEEIQTRGHELYIYYTDGMGRSKLDNSRIERKLKLTSTARNWNTTHKLLNLAETLEM